MSSVLDPRFVVPDVKSIGDARSVVQLGFSRQPRSCKRSASGGWLAGVAARRALAAPEVLSRSCAGYSRCELHEGNFPASERFTFPSRSFSNATLWTRNVVVRAAEGAGADAEAAYSEESQPKSEAGKWQKLERRVEKLGEYLSVAFPLWVGLACLAALALPDATLWIDRRVQVVGLSLTMLSMGMTLTLQDFQAAFALPKELLAGVVLQYTVMPSAGYAVSRILQLPPHYAAGLILVACCPGGTASNIVTYLAKGNVALSVLMTAASTFLAVVMTPTLTARLVGKYIAVDASALFNSTVQVVLLPVLGGAILNHLFHRYVKKVALVAPTIAVFIVAILVAGAVGQNAQAIFASGGQVVLAVMALHISGFAGGYVLSRLLRVDESSCRTISIEVGMQNSVLGVVLAAQHFSNPLTVVPCAVSSVCHSLIGSILAGIWRLSIIKGNVTQHSEPPVGLT